MLAPKQVQSGVLLTHRSGKMKQSASVKQWNVHVGPCFDERFYNLLVVPIEGFVRRSSHTGRGAFLEVVRVPVVYPPLSSFAEGHIGFATAD